MLRQIPPNSSVAARRAVHALLAFVSLSGALLLAGCATRSVTNTPRTAQEQMLLSQAVDVALSKLVLPELTGRRVFVDFGPLESYDSQYVRLAVRTRLSEMGAVLVDRASSEYQVEVASGGLGTEFSEGMIGVPAIPVPQAPVSLPEVPFYRRVRQDAAAKLLILVHEEGEFRATGRFYGAAQRDDMFIFWFRLDRRNDIDEAWRSAELLVDFPQTRLAPSPTEPEPPAEVETISPAPQPAAQAAGAGD